MPAGEGVEEVEEEEEEVKVEAGIDSRAWSEVSAGDFPETLTLFKSYETQLVLAVLVLAMKEA